MSHRSISKRASRRLTAASARARLQSNYDAACVAQTTAEEGLAAWDAAQRKLDAAGHYQGWGGMHRAALCLAKSEATDAAQAAYEALVHYDWRHYPTHCHRHEMPA